MISLIFLVLNLFYKPYCTDGLNNLQVLAASSGLLVGHELT